MKTFEKEYGNLVVTFQNENEYVEMGPGFSNPKFAGVLIREKFSNRGIEIQEGDIKFFLEEFKNLPPFKNYLETKTPLLKIIHRYGWEACTSDFCLVIATYDGIYCKFFLDISHQSVFSGIEIFRSKSPEFKLEDIIKIFEDATKQTKE